jgi:hypothetical protein
MRRTDRPATGMDRTRMNSLDTEQAKTNNYSHDIHNCVQGAHFVKVNVIDGNAVNCCFGGGKIFKNRQGVCFVALFKSGFSNDFANVSPRPGMMPRLWRNSCVGAGDPVLIHAGARNSQLGQAQFPQIQKQIVQVKTGIKECAKKHVSTCSRKRLDPRNTHSVAPIPVIKYRLNATIAKGMVRSTFSG